ncbi:MAG: hypothetical protein L6Q71_08030 [Planctomycetes bacterium]|nr:hypothetical protein [Planctomycetota bacterium]
MPDNERRTNLIAGVFIVAVITAMVGLVMFLQGYEPGEEGKRFLLIFESAPGVQRSTPVKVSGDRVGVVENVLLEQVSIETPEGQKLRTQVKVTVNILPDVLKKIRIYDNAWADVEVSVFGASEVRLYPGGKDASNPEPNELPENSEIMGVTPVSMGDVMRQGQEVMVNVKDITSHFKTLLEDDSIRTQIREGLQRANNVLDKLSSLLKTSETILAEAGPMMTSARKSAEQVEELLAANSAGVTEIVENARTASGRLTSMMEKLDTLATTLNTMAGDVSELSRTSNQLLSGNRGAINEILFNARESSAYLRDVMEKLRRDPSIAVWGTDADDNAADTSPGVRERLADEMVLRKSGRLPPLERD